MTGQRGALGFEPATSPVLVGRSAELAALAAALGLCVESRPVLCLVSGEAGVGKTRLLRAFRDESTTALVLTGGCVPVAEGELPFAPIIEAFRGVDVSFDLPELVGSLSQSSQPRMFELLLGALGRLARQRPLVLAIEDLHWADRSTLGLLAFLARNLSTERVMVVLTCRTSDLPRASHVRPLLAELGRLRPVLRLDLRRLTRAETAKQIAALRGDAATLLDQVFARSEGNPLVTEALVAAGPDGLESVPAGLHDYVLGRLAGLPDATLAVLRLAAVAGRDVHHDVLAALSGLAEDAVLAALDRAVERHVLRPTEDGLRYGFRHALIAEVVYEEMLPERRRRIHASIAGALERDPGLRASDGVTSAAEIAHHWHHAGDDRRALPACVRAGFAALKRFAFAEALHHLRRAVEYWDRVEDADAVAGMGRAAVEAAAAEAAHLMGEDGCAVALAEAALLRVEAVRRAELLNRVGTYHYTAGHRAEAAEAFEGALAALPSAPASAERVRALVGLARIAVAWSDVDTGRRLATQAVSAAEAVRARREEGHARNVLGLAKAHGGEVHAGAAELRAALDIAHEIDEPDDIALAYVNLGYVLALAGHFDDAARVSLQGHREMRRLGLDRQQGSFLLANAAEALLDAGRWKEAESLVAEAETYGTRGSQAYNALLLGARVRTGRGDFDGARERLTRLAGLLAEGGITSWRRWYTEQVADTAVWEGRLTHARAAVLDGLRLLAGTDEERFAGTLLALGLRAEADAAELARARRCDAALEKAMAAGTRLVDVVRSFRPDPFDAAAGTLPADGPLALTCQAELGRLRQAGGDPSLWCAAATAWRGAGRPFLAAYALFRAAEGLLLRGAPVADAAEPLRSAWREADELGAGPLRTACEQLACWHRIDLYVPNEPTTAAHETDLLTEREREILALITMGRTNRQIAETLTISPKTASVHVSNILRKLGVSRRADAARIGYQLGLTPRIPVRQHKALPRVI